MSRLLTEAEWLTPKQALALLRKHDPELTMEDLAGYCTELKLFQVYVRTTRDHGTTSNPSSRLSRTSTVMYMGLAQLVCEPYSQKPIKLGKQQAPRSEQEEQKSDWRKNKSNWNDFSCAARLYGREINVRYALRTLR